MRKLSFIVCSIMIAHVSFAQTEFQANVAKILKYVERNMDIKNEVDKEFRLDFFVYDISLDAKGNITDIHLLILDSVRALSTINQTATGIKNKFSLGKSNFKKVYIPVMIVSGNDEGGNNEKYTSELNTVQFFESLSKRQNKDVFVSRTATIITYQEKK